MKKPKPLHCDKTLRTFEKTRELWKTRTAGEFSNARRVLSQCNTLLTLLYLLINFHRYNNYCKQRLWTTWIKALYEFITIIIIVIIIAIIIFN